MSRPARLLAALLLLLPACLAAATPVLARAPAAPVARAKGGPVCTFIPPLRYPPDLVAAQHHLAGTVLVRVDVDARGHVAASEALPGELPDLFVAEALRAARQSRFLPAPGQGRGELGSLILLLRFPDDGAPPTLTPAVAAPPLTATPTALAASPLPPPPVVATPAPPATASKGALRVLDAGFGHGVEDRRLRDRSEVFAEGEKVYFWMDVEGARVGQVLRQIWIYRGREMQEIALTLKAERWATWSYKTFFPDQRGAWLLELRDEEDDLLGSWSCYCE